MKNKDLTSRNINKLFIKLLPVQIFVCISSSLSALVNGSIVGNNLSALDMSALGLVTPFSTIISAIASIISGGMGIIYGNLLGKGDNKKIDSLFSICINVLIVLGAFISAVVVLLKGPIANFCGANVETLDSCSSYIAGLSVGIIPTLLIPCLMTFLQMSNLANFSLISTILLAIFNYLFDLLVINILHNGVFGIGLASSISYYLVLLIIIIYIKKKKIVNYNIKEKDFNTIKQVVQFGLPFALASFLYSTRNIYINNISSKVGGIVAINSLAILTSTGGIIDSFNIAIGVTYRMLASIYVGERDSHSLKNLFKNTLIISEIIMFIKVVVMILFSEKIAMAFGASGETIKMTNTLYYLYAISSPLNIVTVYLSSTYLTLGKSTYCNVIYLINAFISPVICCYISSITSFGIKGIFSCYYVAEIVTLIFMFVVVIIKNRNFKLNFKQVFNLDKSFDLNNKLSISINSIEQVVNTSIKIEEFCLKQGIDEKRAKLAGLCLEEMAGNVAEHGFKKDKKKHSIDIFARVDNDNISLRIKDDCVGFDPNTRADIYNPDDPSKNVGIRLVSKLAKEMNYQTTFGMNVLTINL